MKARRDVHTFPGDGERGFSLVEVVVATVIAILAITGLAYSFGQGRAMITRFEIARAGLAAAQDQMELLSITAASDSTLALGPANGPGYHGRPFVVGTQTFGVVQWVVTEVDDPADGLASQGTDSIPFDLKRVVLTVSWTGGLSPGDVSITRLFPAQ